MRARAARAVTVAEAQEQFRLVVDAVEDYAIFLLNREGYVASWNRGAEKIKGYAADEILGEHVSRFYTEEDVRARKPDRELEVAVKYGKYSEEGWRVRKDGSLFWASVLVNAVYDESGQVTGFVKITRDFTERKRADGAVRQSEERFRLLVEGVRDYAIYMLDPEGRIVSWNDGARRLKGYTADEIIGRHFSVFYPEEDARAGRPQRELEIARTEGRYEEEGWRVRKDGSRFWANVVVTALRDEGGELRGFAKVTRDLTRRRQAEEQRVELIRSQAARIEAEKSSRMKDEFLAILSHELRTPLNAILGWAHLLRAGNLAPDQAARALETIERNTEVQAQIVTDILDVSRITSGKLRLNPRKIEPAQFVRSAIETTRPAADAKGLDVAVQVGEGISAVWGDPDRLQQVAWNLLSNAVKFTPRGGRIEVRLGAAGSYVELVVSDTGQGISREFLPHVFESFRQADSSSARSHGGLGLGLAIVKQLVELHGGRVEAASQGEGQGSTFRVLLPVAPIVSQSPQPGAEAGEGSAAQSLADLSVLVVEDHDDSRALIVTALRQWGARVMEARDARAGFALIVSERPDVIVSDIEMAGGSGYDLMERIRSLPRDQGGLTPAIALTAYARDEDRLRALSAGFDSHLGKPATPDALAAAITALLGRSRRL
ncbi:MAG TPA: PAS domain S-box protein [Vicinamibacteria bacterium]|nr:PAS domain S-box protein [Vicinamibacteria bacterium]